jgi:hypothetical protein
MRGGDGAPPPREKRRQKKGSSMKKMLLAVVCLISSANMFAAAPKKVGLDDVLKAIDSIAQIDATFRGDTFKNTIAIPLKKAGEAKKLSVGKDALASLVELTNNLLIALGTVRDLSYQYTIGKDTKPLKTLGDALSKVTTPLTQINEQIQVVSDLSQAAELLGF